jgi:hypothetical protein
MSGIFQQARSFATKQTSRGAGLRGVVDSTKLDRTGRHPPLGKLRYPPETRLKFVVSPTPDPMAGLTGRPARGIAYAYGVAADRTRTSRLVDEGVGHAED